MRLLWELKREKMLCVPFFLPVFSPPSFLALIRVWLDRLSLSLLYSPTHVYTHTDSSRGHLYPRLNVTYIRIYEPRSISASKREANDIGFYTIFI